MMALNQMEAVTSTVRECMKKLCSLGKKIKVTLKWIKAHSGNPGNERADTLAKQGALTKSIGPFPRLGLSHTCNKDSIKLAMINQWNEAWDKESGTYLHTRDWFPQYDTKKAAKIRQLDRITLGQLISATTGFNYLNKHQAKMDPHISPYC